VSATDIFTGIYVKDVSKTASLFERALGAEARTLQPDMVELRVGNGRLLLNDESMAGSMEQLDAGKPEQQLEFGIFVDDIETVHENIVVITKTSAKSEIPFISDIEERKSGLRDFRFKLPEGYYVRITADAA
jgi:hypothetical protein